MRAGRRSTTPSAAPSSRAAAAPRRCRQARRPPHPGARRRHRLSFQDYGPDHEVYGIDLSEPMIARARDRMASGAFPHVKDVQVMDAHDLAFPDGMFDAITAQFVITLVERPERVLDECARVLKPGGEIILVNHLYSEKGLAARRALVLQARPRLRPAPGIPLPPLEAWAAAMAAWRWWSAAASPCSASTRWSASASALPPTPLRRSSPPRAEPRRCRSATGRARGLRPAPRTLIRWDGTPIQPPVRRSFRRPPCAAPSTTPPRKAPPRAAAPTRPSAPCRNGT